MCSTIQQEKETAVTLIAKYRVRDGKTIEEIRSMVAQFTSSVKANEKSSCLYYSWSIQQHQTEDQKTSLLLCCQESYRDVSGVLRHLENVGPLFAPFLALAKFESSEVYAPDWAMEAIRRSPIGQWNATYYSILGDVHGGHGNVN